MPTGVATIVHLSDLHLGGAALDTGRPDKATASSFWKKRRLEMQTHDPYVFACLRTNLKSAARCVGAEGDRFDFYLVTGDISTNATSAERFSFARNFLLDSIPLDASFSAGLQLDPESLFCVPGNHDKMQS